jgi:acetyl-CoA C-acetyltransferase
MPGSVIVSGARTPIGKMAGAFAGLSAAQLGGVAIAEAVKRAGLTPQQIEHVIMGQVLLAGAGQLPARQASLAAGLPMNVPATIVNKVCLSGLNAIYQADQMIHSGDADIVVAGGMESMTNAPYLIPNGRSGYKYGNAELLDATFHDGLFCAIEHVAMGASTERYGTDVNGLSRSRQDEFAAQSHERAAAAAKDGRFGEEIVPVAIPQRKGDPLMVDTDEGVRPGTTAESLGGLRPAFDKTGTITAGNASQISDGASAVVMMSAAKAAELGITPLGEVVSYGMVAGPDNPSLLLQPANAIRKALAKAKLSISDLSLLEMNEAFASVALASAEQLHWVIRSVHREIVLHLHCCWSFVVAVAPTALQRCAGAAVRAMHSSSVPSRSPRGER